MNRKYSLQSDTKLVSLELSERDFNDMADIDEKPRSIRFPQMLWDEIDRDAKKAKRSAVKQMEVVLSMYYGIEDNEVDKEKLSQMRERQTIGISSESAGTNDLKNKKMKIPVLEPAGANDRKGKK